MADFSKTKPTLVVGDVSLGDREDFKRSVEALSKSELVQALSNKGARVIVMPDVLEQRVPRVRPEDLMKPLTAEMVVPLVRAPDFHPRRRLQIRGAVAAMSAVAAVGAGMATPRIEQQLKDDVDRFNRPSKAKKQRRKQRKRQRQARKKSR